MNPRFHWLLRLIRHPATGFGLAAAVSLAAPVAQAQSGGTVALDLTIDNRALTQTLEESGGFPVLRVQKGDRVSITWRADEPTELHLHGFDITINLEPGETKTFNLDAAVTGRFELEVHEFGGGEGRAPSEVEEPLLFLEVLPK